MIRVINIYHHKTILPEDVFCGRQSPLGNPWTSQPLERTLAEFQASSREDSIEKYRVWLTKKIEEKDTGVRRALNEIYKKALLGDVNLVCFCAPKPCHCDVIKEVIEAKMKM